MNRLICLERNIVGRGRRRRRGRSTAAALRAGRRSGRFAKVAAVIVLLRRSAAATSTAATTSTTFAAEHLHPLADDAQFGSLLPVSLPRVELQPPFDQHLRTLAEIFPGYLGGATPERDID